MPQKESSILIIYVSSGVGAICPLNDTQFFKPSDTPCNLNTGLCDRGVCRGRKGCDFIQNEVYFS